MILSILRDHGIDVVAPLRVGQNLADHTSSAFIFRRNDGGPFQRNMRLDRVVPSLIRAYLGKGGFAADLPFGITAFLENIPRSRGSRYTNAILDGCDHDGISLVAAF